ncbi:MAG TPA: hypothetical protein VG538_14730 [Vicinamibacterales bacterium]|nr:hypothetical protein [Vicinamibacterales bacterium]
MPAKQLVQPAHFVWTKNDVHLILDHELATFCSLDHAESQSDVDIRGH